MEDNSLIESYLSSGIKLNTECIKNLNIRCSIMNLLEKNIDFVSKYKYR